MPVTENKTDTVPALQCEAMPAPEEFTVRINTGMFASDMWLKK